MNERYIEKSFLVLLACSLLLHLGAFLLLLSLPVEKKSELSEPLMVDLQDLPELKEEKPAPGPPARRQAEERRRVPRESAPRGMAERDRLVAPVQPTVPAYRPPARGGEQFVPQRPTERGEAPGGEPSPKEELFRPKAGRGGEQQPKLVQSATAMARLEEEYRRKYAPNVAEGDTRFLNTDDILFGSFLRRFETAVYGVWRYPSEAARLGIEGVTPVRITFNRNGEIIQKEILQSSGSRILDEEVLRTLGQIGSVGRFPRGYDKDSFNLIAFFRYGIVRGGTRSLH